MENSMKNSMKNIQVTWFDSCYRKTHTVMTLEQVVMRANDAMHKQVIKQIEAAAARGDKAGADQLKRSLPAVVFGGVFRGGHAISNLVRGSGLLVLDFDKLSLEQVDAALGRLREQISVVMAAPSPTGRGVKVVVRTDHDPAVHAEVFAAVSKYFEELLQLEVDQSGKDISRLCFLFGAEALYFNPLAQPLDLSHLGTRADVAPPADAASSAQTDEVSSLEPAEASSLEPSGASSLEPSAIPCGNASVVPSALPLSALPLSLDEEQQRHVAKELKRCALLSTRCEAWQDFKEGARNTFLYKWACNACKCGIPEGIARLWAEDRYLCKDLGKAEIAGTLKSAYVKNALLMGSEAHRLQLPDEVLPFASENGEASQGEGEDVPKGDELYKHTPYLPDSIFEHLPPVFEQVLLAAKNKRERDIILYSTLGVLSGCMPGVTGEYGGQKYSPHSYYFIIAKAGSGKGKAALPFRLISKYSAFIHIESDARVKNYEQEVKNFEAYCSKMKKDHQPIDISREPVVEHEIVIWDSGNISKPKLIDRLSRNGAYGMVVLETEADVMSTNNKTEWGDIDVLLRGSAHHDPISMSRSEKEKNVRIDMPRLAFVLTGTPDQFVRLVRSADNGLYSRIGTYVFGEEEEWYSPAPKDNLANQDQHYDALASIVLEHACFLRENPTTFTLSDKQWNRFNSTMAPQLRRAHLLGLANEPSVVKRIGLIAFRAAMTLSAHRRAERQSPISEIVCTDEDFEVALAIGLVSLEHSRLLLSGLVTTDEFSKKLTPQTNEDEIFAKLPAEFKTRDALNLCAELKVSGTTMKRLLAEYVKENRLAKLRKGCYQKVAQEAS